MMHNIGLSQLAALRKMLPDSGVAYYDRPLFHLSRNLTPANKKKSSMRKTLNYPRGILLGIFGGGVRPVLQILTLV